jgi:hypothetical protein
MTRPRLYGGGLALVAASAFAQPVETPDLDASRDELIAKIVRGTDYDQSVQEFAALLAKRDQRTATSKAARDRQREAAQAIRARQDAYHKTGDYAVSWRCTMSVDPAHPVPSREGRFAFDWGKVVRKEKIRLPPKNALDEGEPTTIYEVAGVRQPYVFRGEHFAESRGAAFEAEVGDLVAVCTSGESQLPAGVPDWAQRVISSGFAVHISRPPLITEKARWNPAHVTRTVFFWAIHDARWRFPDDQYLLASVEVDEDLGDGRYRIVEQRTESWILEVPPGVKNRELLVPGHEAWIIMGHHRFDPTLKKLVLVAEDIEDRYLSER